MSKLPPLLVVALVAASALAGCQRSPTPPIAAPVAPPPVAESAGRVLDGEDPLIGATVRLQATTHTATTGADGGFRLPAGVRAAHVTAWKEGYFIGFAAPDAAPLDVRLKRLPTGDDPNYQWIDSGAGADGQGCAKCHDAIYKEWSLSAHSRSATGKHFRNLYDGTNWSGKPGVGWSLRDENPTGLAVCTSCHAPAVGENDPAQYDLADLKGTAAQGVHCDYCHKIAGVRDGKLGLTHGRFNLHLLRSQKEQVFLGPLDDATRGEDAYSPLYHDSRYCASCHEGVVFGVHVYSTFSEWRDSPAFRKGQQCQDCHMKPTGRMTNLAPGAGGVERDPRTLANHRLYDGNLEEMLRGCMRAAVECRRDAQGVRATVDLTAEGSGHRVPTGFIDRHLILTVDGEDAAGRPVAARDGPRLPPAAGKEHSGQAGKLYAKLLHDFDGHSPAPFWRADPDATDTRLQPNQADETAYTFPPTVQRVHVRVLYRRFWEEVARTKHWPDQDIVVLDETAEVGQRPAGD
ncbi:MAG TPA: multiheme c-type cytochrome [Gemmataceae bacterium]|nr:multiheme c-type cytochrome [Gemmataceae bacterium]